MLSRNEIKSHIENKLGIPVKREREHATEYGATDYPFYIKKDNKCPLVIHPDLMPILRANPIDGVQLEGEPYHNANLAAFPKLNPDQAKCGYDLEVAGTLPLEELLVRIGAIPARAPATSSPLDDIKQAEPTLAGLPETQRETLVQARLGQGQFRDSLMSVWRSSCAVTGISVHALLRASHIKPWRLSNNSERLDPENGLLLMANLDAAFDAGLVSFSDEGEMLFSSAVGSAPYELLGISPGATLTIPPSPRQQGFLHHHRIAAGL